jgi:7-carboxy-7-deazaguanine synthase
MRIAEIYRSVQGEGFLTGTSSVFIRGSGCNLRCWFCDTPHASWRPHGEDMSVEEIVRQTLGHGEDHVVITGGEPMLWAEMIPLCGQLRQAGLHVTIETAATLYLPVACDLMSISPKLSNSQPPVEEEPRWHKRHEEARHAPDVIRRLVAEHHYQFKFVVDTPSDGAEVRRYLNDFPEIERSRVMLMPQGTDLDGLERTSRWLQPYCREHGFQFCPRKQIEWFGLVRRT